MKKIFTSWTVWFGIAQIGYGLIGLGFGIGDSAMNTTLIFTGLGSLGLRFKTTTPII